ncbi:MAG: phosphoribosylformylglycinamidine synthase subunit PurS [Negativicutes bacterium]|nr:phosphoribosylformylglycinamidine synthase subunit PurS [Negativicutes bacterium]
MFKVKVMVSLKSGVLDPQGAAVERSFGAHGYANVSTVRVGKVIEFLLKESDRTVAEEQVKKLADQFLANPVMENFTFELEEVK